MFWPESIEGSFKILFFFFPMSDFNPTSLNLGEGFTLVSQWKDRMDYFSFKITALGDNNTTDPWTTLVWTVKFYLKMGFFQ